MWPLLARLQDSSSLAQYRQTQCTTTTCGKTKDGINHQYAEQLEWCVLEKIIERKPKIVAIIGDCTLVDLHKMDESILSITDFCVASTF